MANACLLSRVGTRNAYKRKNEWKLSKYDKVKSGICLCSAWTHWPRLLEKLTNMYNKMKLQKLVAKCKLSEVFWWLLLLRNFEAMALSCLLETTKPVVCNKQDYKKSWNVLYFLGKNIHSKLFQHIYKLFEANFCQIMPKT